MNMDLVLCVINARFFACQIYGQKVSNTGDCETKFLAHHATAGQMSAARKREPWRFVM